MDDKNTFEKDSQALDKVAGGKVNKNITPGPGGIGGVVDSTLNGKNYDAVAEALLKKIQPPPPRSRKVNNDVDIYDVDV